MEMGKQEIIVLFRSPIRLLSSSAPRDVAESVVPLLFVVCGPRLAGAIPIVRESRETWGWARRSTWPQVYDMCVRTFHSWIYVILPPSPPPVEWLKNDFCLWFSPLSLSLSFLWPKLLAWLESGWAVAPGRAKMCGGTKKNKWKLV